MLAKTSVTEWSMAGDPCPRCGETETIIAGFTNPVARAIPPEDGPFIQVAPPSYTMRCGTCRHSERKNGIPGI